MATETSSIDDVLAGSHLPPQPQPKEEIIDSSPEDVSDYESPASEEQEEKKAFSYERDPNIKDEKAEESEPEPLAVETDDYGNEKPKQESKTYTEEEVNERINRAVRERLARLKEAPVPPAVQQDVKKDFEYDPAAEGNWQQQLESFVEQTVSKMTQKQQQQVQQQREQQAQQEFEAKFHQGMGKFHDFVQVVGQQPITDAMTVATRAMKDPAAFLYAASKRHSQELQRIANMPDQYAQMVEIGKLEERMRKNKSISKAPRPLSQTREDSIVEQRSAKEPTIEEMMAAADAKRLAKMKARRS